MSQYKRLRESWLSHSTQRLLHCCSLSLRPVSSRGALCHCVLIPETLRRRGGDVTSMCRISYHWRVNPIVGSNAVVGEPGASVILPQIAGGWRPPGDGDDDGNVDHNDDDDGSTVDVLVHKRWFFSPVNLSPVAALRLVSHVPTASCVRLSSSQDSIN